MLRKIRIQSFSTFSFMHLSPEGRAQVQATGAPLWTNKVNTVNFPLVKAEPNTCSVNQQKYVLALICFALGLERVTCTLIHLKLQSCTFGLCSC